MSDDATPTTIDPTIDPTLDEGEVAADYLEELLDIADLDGDLDIEERAGRVYLSVAAEEPDALRTLSKPETVSALQELTRLAVLARTGEFSRLILDIAGSRDSRPCRATSASSCTISSRSAASPRSPRVRARSGTRSSVAPSAHVSRET